MNFGLQAYEQYMVLPRERFAISPSLTAILSPTMDPALFELFLVHFCATGVHMTEQVAGWICRAGERCAELGLEDLGRALKSHAKGEAGHHLLMIADVKTLTTRWNTHGAPHLDSDTLLPQPPSLGVRRYCEVYEHTIAGHTPFAQMAIEYEIEMLSLRYGQRLLTNCVAQLGRDILGCLSFLTDHVEAEWRLLPWTTPRLREFWRVTTPGAVTGTPVVVKVVIGRAVGAHGDTSQRHALELANCILQGGGNRGGRICARHRLSIGD